MKLLLTSDLQLEAGAALGTGEFGAGSRFQDQVDVMSRILELAVKEQVEVVGVLGDVFERSRPAPWAVIAFQSFVRGCVERGIQVLVVSGNHDVSSAALPSALSIFDDPGVSVSLTPSLYPIVFDHASCVIATLPWTPISRLVAAQPNLSRSQLNDLAAAALVESAHLLGDRCAAEYPDLPAILVGHWAISGASTPTGLSTDLLPEPVIPAEGLATAGFNLVAFGHIHAVQVVTAVPSAVVYCGSPMVCNWAETESQHGVWIYDTEGDGALRFNPIEDRKFMNLDGAVVSDPSVYRGIGGLDLGVAANHKDVFGGALVRVRYSCTEEEAKLVDEAEVRRLLIGAGAAKVFIKATVERTSRARVADVAEGIDESAAFEMWLATQSVPDGDLQALRDLHAGYMEASRG